MWMGVPSHMPIPHRLWERRHDYPLFVVLSALTVATLFVWPLVDFSLREMGVGIPFGFNDFGVYGGTIDRWRALGEVYDQTETGGYHGSYLYPPVTLLLFWPFKGFEFVTGAVLLGGTMLVLLWMGLEAVALALGYRLCIWERLVLLVALFGFAPALRDFKWAQIASLLTAFLCFAFYTGELAERGAGARYRYASGAFTTLGSAFKLFFATSGAHLLRDRARLAGALGTAALLGAASLLVFGVEVHRAYLDVLLWGKGWGGTRAPYLWDASAAYRPLYVLGGFGMAARVLGVLGVIALTLAARDATATAARHATFALGVAVIPLLAPLADLHDLVVLLLPAVILVAVELDRPDGYPSVPVLAVLLLHAHRYVVEVLIESPQSVPLLTRGHAPWLQPGMWATFLLVGLAAVRVGEHATLPAAVRRPRTASAKTDD